MNVESLPQTLGGKRRTGVNSRISATASKMYRSRPKIIETNHQGRIEDAARERKTPLSKHLSAIGSRYAPVRVMAPKRRATAPSIESVMAAQANRISAVTCLSLKTDWIIKGTRTIRKTVKQLGMFNQRGILTRV